MEDPLEALDAAVAPIEQEILADLSEVFQQTGQAFDGTAEQKKAFKKKSAAWARSNPFPRLSLLTQVMEILRGLQHKFFHLGSQAYNRKEAYRSARGKPRSFKVVEVALGHDIARAFVSICEAFLRCPKALPIKAQTLQNRSLSFRLLSRFGCALHQLMRSVHKNHPYRLFLLLVGAVEDILNEPACLREEFSHDFLQRFKDHECEAMATAYLEAAAEAVEIDISCLEAKHAFSRRASIMKSLQTWTASLESLNMMWLIHQVQKHDKTFQKSRAEEQPQQPHNPDAANTEKKPGGGGGAWRAFIHVNYAGQRGGRALWKKIAEEYRNLDAASKAHYVRIGKLGTIAWRARGGKKRHAAFGKPLEASQPSNYGPNQITDAVVIVATDADRPQALVSRVACKFDKGLKALRSEQRLAVKAMKQEMEKEESALNKHTQEALLSTPWVVPGVCASDTFHDASAGGCSCKITKLEWNAPVAAFTDVPGRSCIY